MKTEYNAVWSIGPTLYDLVRQVDEYLEDDWRPTGGLCTWKDGRDARRFGQAIMRTSIEHVDSKTFLHKEWIKTADRMPEPDTNILHCAYNTVYASFYHDGLFIVMGCAGTKASHVSHWMPFPEAPEEE